MRKRLYPFFFLLLGALASCGDSDEQVEQAENKVARGFQCDADNGSLTLPSGFCAGVVADNLGIVRHLVVHENGTIYVSQRHRNLNVGGLLTLQDEDGDGRMDKVLRSSDEPGMGIGLFQDHLFFATDQKLYRYRLSDEDSLPITPPDIIVKQFPYQEQHSGRAITLDEKGRVYVNIGSKSNACQREDRKVASPGRTPCLELERHAGIWRFSGNALLQEYPQGYRYASGVRNAYALDWHPELKQLYVTQHGRDQLHELWPDYFTEEQERQLPAEELLLIEEDRFYGWPYCYYDQIQDKRLLAPEYGGDGLREERCATIPKAVVGFPGHFGPSDMVFYQGDLFPQEYQGGAFIAFHGAYYENETERKGYQVVFVKREGETLASDWQVFADHFAGETSISSLQDAEYRPIGIALGADGSLYIADSVQGRIWRVIYEGDQ